MPESLMAAKVLGSSWRAVSANLAKEDAALPMAWVGGYGNKKTIAFETDHIGEQKKTESRVWVECIIICYCTLLL